MSNDSCSTPITDFQRLIFDCEELSFPLLLSLTTLDQILKKSHETKPVSSGLCGLLLMVVGWIPCEEDNEGPDDDQNGHPYCLLTITNKPHHRFRPLVSGHWLQLVLMQSVWIP